MPERFWELRAADLMVREHPFENLKIARLRQPDSKALAKLQRLLGIAAWPEKPNTAIGAAPRVVWMSPTEWLVQDSLLTSRALAKAAGAVTNHLADISHGRTMYVVEGAGARHLLAKGCALDLHACAFQAGQCAQTVFAQIPILLDCVSDAPIFRLYADVSFTAYLKHWFDDATIEFGVVGDHA